MRREGVAQRVRRGPLRDPGAFRRAPDDAPGADARERPSPRVEKQEAPALAPVETRPDRAGVERDRAQSAAPDGNEPLLRSLAEEPRDALLEEHVGGLDPDQLRNAGAGGIAELEQRPVANAARLVGGGRREEPVYF